MNIFSIAIGTDIGIGAIIGTALLIGLYVVLITSNGVRGKDDKKNKNGED